MLAVDVVDWFFIIKGRKHFSAVIFANKVIAFNAKQDR